MRLWSLHPGYLDVKGLVACWREGLLARKVLQGQTKGYRHHPQLQRFRSAAEPVAVLDRYLLCFYQESLKRGYAFNREKIGPVFSEERLTVTRGQIQFERLHLLEKLARRDPERRDSLLQIPEPEANSVFTVIPGEIEGWEK